MSRGSADRTERDPRCILDFTQTIEDWVLGSLSYCQEDPLRCVRELMAYQKEKFLDNEEWCENWRLAEDHLRNAIRASGFRRESADALVLAMAAGIRMGRSHPDFFGDYMQHGAKMASMRHRANAAKQEDRRTRNIRIRSKSRALLKRMHKKTAVYAQLAIENQLSPRRIQQIVREE